MAGFNLHNRPLLKHEKESYCYDGLDYFVHEDADSFELSSQTPKNYPFRKIDDGIYLEGYTYNADARLIGQQIQDLLNNGSHQKIADLIKTLDGEFAFLFFQKNEKVTLVNDRWGHLPIYLWKEERNFILSRNISFITKGVNLSYNRVSMGVMLLMSTTLENDTLWTEVNRISPHSICEINLFSGKIEECSYYKFDQFEGDISIKAIIPKLKEAVDKSMADRLKNLHNPALSLSGGLDSRLAAASICEISMDIPFITHKRPSGIDDPDCAAAKIISSRLGVKDNHTIVELDKDQYEDILHLTDIKQGLNSASMGHILPFHKYFSDRNWSCISDYGGGGKFFRKLYPHTKVNTDSDLVNYILKFHTLVHPKKAAEICGLESNVLVEKLRKQIECYPSTKASDKYAYFMFREVLINWAYEADRQRNYSWVTVPFYSPDVVKLCFSVSQEAKKGGRLFNLLFDAYPGELGNIENPNWRVSLNDEKAIDKLFKRQGIKGKLPLTYILHRKKGQFNEFPFRNELLENKNRNGYFKLDELPGKANMNFYWQLLTLLILTNED